MKRKRLYIIKSGNGYFVRELITTGCMSFMFDSDPLFATRLYKKKALGVAIRMVYCGLSAEIIKIIIKKRRPA